MRWAWLCMGVLLALGGCAMTAQLYPANDTAHTLGPLVANMKAYGVGSGPVSVTMPDGEVLVGRYSVNMGGSASFGSLYTSVYGSRGYASASGFGSAFSMPNSSGGMADLIGPRGTTAHCEFVNNNWGGHGNGACQLSGGQVYRMQY